LFLILLWTLIFSGDSSQNTTVSSCHFFFSHTLSLQLIMGVGRLTSGLLACCLRYCLLQSSLKANRPGYSSIQDIYCCYKQKGTFNICITQTYPKPIKSSSRVVLLDMF